MREHALYPLATQFRLELKNMDGLASLQVFSDVLPVSILGLFGLPCPGGY